MAEARRKKQYICETCGQNYSSHSSLYMHRRRFHKMNHAFKSEYPVTENKCDVDAESPADESLLPRCRMCKEFFIRQVCCGPETANICSFCTKSLINVGALEREREKPREKRYPCDICHKKYRCKSELKRHTASHKNEKPYICDECGRGFIDQKSQDYHKRIHLKVKPFSCSLCDKQFVDTRALRQHFIQHVEEVAIETKIKNEPD